MQADATPEPAAEAVAAAPTVVTTAVPAAVPRAEARAAAPTIAAPTRPESGTPPALLADDDLPAWLRKLNDAPAVAAAPSRPAPTPTARHLPTWATPASPAVAPPAGPVDATEAAPPVWAPRDSTSAPGAAGGVAGGAAIFAALAEASATGNPIEPEAPAAPAERAIPWWWLVAAAIALALVIAVILFGVMPMLAGRAG